MASPANPMMAPQGAPSATPPQGGAPSPAAAGGPPRAGAVLQLVAIIAKASDQLKQVFPAATPMADEIQNQLRLAQSKISATTSPQQPQAPPI